MNNRDLDFFLNIYLKERPLFLALVRAQEAALFQKYLPFGKPVLDFGCGDGFFAKTAFGGNSKLKSQNYILEAGLDVKESRISQARRLKVYKKLVIYGGKTIPFPDKYFSTVVSNCVLEHLPDLSSSLKEIRRVLKPEGVFLTAVTTKIWEDNLLGSRFFGDYYRRWMRRRQVHHNLFSQKEWEEIFEKSGFAILEKTGYLSPAACTIADLFHYLCLPNLLCYKFTGKWSLFNNFPYNLFGRVMLPLLAKESPASCSAGLFFILKKISVVQPPHLGGG